MGLFVTIAVAVAVGVGATSAAPPGAAKVPATARWLNVSRQVGGSKSTFQVIRSARKVRRIAHAIDLLPADQLQGVIYACPVLSGLGRASVRMRFRARKGGPVLAEASMRMPADVCEPLGLRVAGDPRGFALDDGAKVVAMLHR